MYTTKINQKKNNQIVEGVWTIDLMSNNEDNEYYYPPNNSAELLIILEGEVQRKSIGSSHLYTLKKNNVYLSNIRSKGSIFVPSGKTSLLLIKLNPSTQKIFMKEGLLYARNKINVLDIPAQNSFVWKKYIATRNIRKILNYLDSFIIDLRTDKKLKKDSTVSSSIDIIRKKNGNVLVKDIYQKMGVCKSTLEHKFNKEVGLSPKEFCKIEKLNHFFSNYKVHEKELTLTELTYKSGYYDQSHLIKDFRFYVEQNPKKFLSGKKKILL